MAAKPDQPTDHDYDADPAFALHRGGKLEVRSTVPVRDADDLSLAYTPGVARVCMAIAEEPDLVNDYTWVSKVVAVVTDGTAVLGLGDIGPAAAMPVMEGKSLLFKEFAGVDSVPICLDCTDADDLVETVIRLAPSFGGINLEDISAPRCFEVEDRLRAALDIPVFHDDQHGTAIVVLAALRNASRLIGKPLSEMRARRGRSGRLGRRRLPHPAGGRHRRHRRLRQQGPDLRRPRRPQPGQAGAGPRHQPGGAEGLDRGRPASAPTSSSACPAAPSARTAWTPWPTTPSCSRCPTRTPEIQPEVARRHARVVATGRSDYPNQINNVLAFPGVFRGALDVRAHSITEGMKLAAATALADVVGDDLSEDYVIPSPFDERVAPAVIKAVADQARDEGVARI